MTTVDNSHRLWKSKKGAAISFLKFLCYNVSELKKSNIRCAKWTPSFYLRFFMNTYYIGQVINMNTLSIHNPFNAGITAIPNYFLDHYMPKANGEFVKIYLYLLRASTSNGNISLNAVADSMNCTEKDVIRALKYWEKEGLLHISYDPIGNPEALSFTDMYQNSTSANNLTTDMSSAVIKKSIENSTETTNNTDTRTAVYSNAGNAVCSETEIFSSSDTTTNSSAQTTATEKTPIKKATLTAEKVKQLKENEDIAQLLFIAQQYLGKTLTPSETNRILYFYDGLEFSTDLIEYLIEYCVSKGHKSMHYIEKVAFAWKEDGITSVASAKKSSEGYHKDYYTILKALGIRGRNPIDAEVSIMKTWKDEYGFTLELIVEACTRTILATNQPSLQYADRILQSWKKANVHSMADIHKLDLAHEQTKNEKQTRKSPKPAAATKFSNFEQRNYDFDSLESQLLNQ